MGKAAAASQSLSRAAVGGRSGSLEVAATPESGPAAEPLRLTFAGVLTAVAVAAVAAAASHPSTRNARDAYANPNTAEVLAQQGHVQRLRGELDAVPGDAGPHAEFADALRELHRLPSYRHVGNLSAPQHRYSAGRLLGDAATITRYQEGMLLHGSPVQLLDPPLMQLLQPDDVGAGWAAYNPSVLPVHWLGAPAFLVTFRVSTWSLCAWDAQRSPVETLPLVDGRRQVTSKVAAAILGRGLGVARPPHDVEGLGHAEHRCNHHTGMRRVGVDDGRLFSLRGAPWMLFAAVAWPGQTAYCFHRLMLCPLALPEAAAGRVRCRRKTAVRYERADEISEAHHAAGRLANVHQKNWSPFVVGDRLYLVFTIEPLAVVRVDPETGECARVSEARTPAMRPLRGGGGTQGAAAYSTFGLHGGTPHIQLPAPHADELLGIGRVARGNTRYTLFFFTIAAAGGEDAGAPTAFRIARASPIFCFSSTAPAHAGLCETIQFAGGLMVDTESAGGNGTNLVVTYGTNDCEAKVAFVPLSQVLSMLSPAW